MAKITRRNFLQFSTSLGLAAGFHQLMPIATQAADPTNNINNDPNIIKLTIGKTPFRIGKQTGTAVTVNNSLPAPLIRLKEGQLATIQVTNTLKEDTSIHWHGIILPANMDGVPGISFAGIKPNQTFTYQFPVNQAGTYWYHSHSMLQEQQGHLGAMIIDPITPDPFEYDQDYVILLSDWTFENPHSVLAKLKKMPSFYKYKRRTIANLAEDWDWRGMRMDPVDIADVTGLTYTYLMNGLSPEANFTGIFQPGNKVRLRFINGSAMTFFDVRIPGLSMTVVQADGQNVQPVTVDEFRIGAAETYDVIVQPQAEAYTIFAETMDRSGYARGTLAIKEGMTAPIPARRKPPVRTMVDMGHGDHANHSQMNHDMPTVDHSQMNHDMPAVDHSNHSDHMNHDMPAVDHSNHSDHMNHDMPAVDHSNHSDHMNHNMPDTTPVMHGPDHHGLGNAAVPMMVKNRLGEAGIGLENSERKVLVYTDLRSLEPWPDQRKPDRELELHLTGNMERYMWSFDGKKHSESPEIDFYYGERLRLTFVNDTMMEHPIHLHGMWMELDNGAGTNKPRKHTLIVKPAEKCSVEINVDAKGKWAFHCHLLYHMHTGMMRTIVVNT
jgi:CopA family copper-resistance protein